MCLFLIANVESDYKMPKHFCTIQETEETDATTYERSAPSWWHGPEENYFCNGSTTYEWVSEPKIQYTATCVVSKKSATGISVKQACFKLKHVCCAFHIKKPN